MPSEYFLGCDGAQQPRRRAWSWCARARHPAPAPAFKSPVLAPPARATTTAAAGRDRAARRRGRVRRREPRRLESSVGRSGRRRRHRARTLATRSLTARSAGAPHVAVTAPTAVSANWTAVARVYGQPAAWIAQRSGVTLMRFAQSRVHLTLHAGSSDGGVVGWTYGDQITPREIHLVLAGFNGGFKLTYSNVGFMSGGRVAVALKPGLASIVTYTDGTSNVGTWHNGVPSTRKTVFSVLQNQRLLVDRGVAASTVTNCVITCWGGTIQDLVSSRARASESPNPGNWSGRPVSSCPLPGWRTR